jgi:hypothetical protein
VADTAWLRTPIDAFVLARLEREGLKPAPPADRYTLLRRVFLDLIGLPPTPQEQEAFVHDAAPDAFARVVDRLLARPEYGGRWARHWLDVVRYAETNGYERDGAKPSAWRYRDYVIRALNRDKPYDRFLTEQLAGDQLPDANAETQTATTFLRLGTWDDEPADPLVDRYDQLDDVLGTTATAFLGITLRCARCHDHKFEPFLQSDYYSMLAVFEPLKRPQNGQQEFDRHVGTAAELAAYHAAYHAAVAQPSAPVAERQKQIVTLDRAVRDRSLAKAETAKVITAGAKAMGVPPEALAAFRADAVRRTPAQKELVKKFGDRLEKVVWATATAEEKLRRAILEKEIDTLIAARVKEPPRAYIWDEDSPKAPTTRVFRRGDPTRPREQVEPDVPTVLGRKPPAAPVPTAKSTGRRLWLACWMTRPDNPLVARVMVNRIWQSHFGTGLVASANDFGVMGQPPSHPELLDWLASELVANGWPMKRLHRLIVLSNTYQTSARRTAGEADGEPALLRRWRPRRLEAEAVRDSVLAVSGRLNQHMGGPSVYPPVPRAVLEGQSRPGDGWGKSDEREASRRSVYIFAKRSLAVPELELLDTPDTTSSCERRTVSTTGPQALTLLNGEFMHEQAHYFAERLEREAGQSAEAQVRRAFTLALARLPRPPEVRAALDFLFTQQHQIMADGRPHPVDPSSARRKALEAFCLVLLNTNEFVYLP